MSFNGYLRRRSLCTSSRTEAPFAQCEPRFIGLSQLGSWPIHTPLETSAVTVQPTAQWVQIFLRIVTCAPGVGGGPAFAVRRLPTGSVPREMRAPPTRPDRRRNVRRSRRPSTSLAITTAAPRDFWRSVLLISTIVSSARIRVDAIEGLHVIAFLISSLPLFIGRFVIGIRVVQKERHACRRRSGDAKSMQELTSCKPCVSGWFRHCALLPLRLLANCELGRRRLAILRANFPSKQVLNKRI